MAPYARFCNVLAGRKVPIEKTLLTGNTCAHLMYDLYLILMTKYLFALCVFVASCNSRNAGQNRS